MARASQRWDPDGGRGDEEDLGSGVVPRLHAFMGHRSLEDSKREQGAHAASSAQAGGAGGVLSLLRGRGVDEAGDAQGSPVEDNVVVAGGSALRKFPNSLFARSFL